MSSIVSTRVRPAEAVMPFGPAIATQMPLRWPAEVLAPDQSTATTSPRNAGGPGTCEEYVALVSGELLLEARGLVKDYRRTRAVDGIDVVVGAGERVALLGPNGAGKTTTLLMILGVVRPDHGSLTVCRFPLEHERSREAECVGCAAGSLP